ncbi:YebC/PmpR family DNA-binding transcriptional regulator [Candidatus Saccharibacteria bacterium]|nr:YebC/PmpR family DNA-binding transcriptional regulator [Candidatus Saccharibacteria bacterium]
MSGHSKWSTIKREKGTKDAKRGAVFTKLGNMIAIAARGGADPSMNPTLALAIDRAKASNMPLANIQRAIDRVSDKNQAVLEEITYEAYGPGGIALLIETATDNKNRTYPEVRTAVTKHGGTMADAGSVAFQFERKGQIVVSETGDEALMIALDAGAEDAREEDGELFIYTEARDMHAVLDKIKLAGLTVKEAELTYVANVDVLVEDQEKTDKILRLMDSIDDLDDVVNVHTNADLQV